MVQEGRGYDVRLGGHTARITFRRTNGDLEISYRHRDGGIEVLTVPWSERVEDVYRSYKERASGAVKKLMDIDAVRTRIYAVFERYRTESKPDGTPAQ